MYKTITANCEYAQTAFNDCSVACQYKGHEYDCPNIKAFFENKNKVVVTEVPK